MASPGKYFITTAIDYPNSRPHIGTAFEKIGADIQARYRRMEGYDVFFLMGNDENTAKVSKKAAEVGVETQAYCDDMARQFREVWDALDISYDVFIQTSSERHKQCCRKFIQKVYDNGYIHKDKYEGWYCDGCEEFKSDKQHQESNGICPNHKTPLTRRSEDCYFFKLSQFSEKLLAFYKENPDFIQPESRRNEIISLIENEGLRDINISRLNQNWGVRIPFDEQFTIYVWFDALLTYITGIGYGDNEALFNRYWPCDTHFIGKDITRFHCALWPAMLMAAGVSPPKRVFGHGFVYVKNEETGVAEKISKSLGNVIEPIDIIRKFSPEAFRYYFMKECPFPGDGDFSYQRFMEVYNSDLANNLGNLYSRCVTLISKNYDGVLEASPENLPDVDVSTLVKKVQSHIEACEYNQALQVVVLELLNSANKYTDTKEPWKLVKTEKEATKLVLRTMVESLRKASILLKPFLPKSMEKLYKSIGFAQKWEDVKYADAARNGTETSIKVMPVLDEKGKIIPLFPRIEAK